MNTIVALATPAGQSAIGVIRLSGPESLSIAQALAGSDFQPEPAVVALRTIRSPKDHQVIDQALLTYFQGPHSYTGEDVIEFSCHGSPVVLRQILDLMLQLGARLAEPGEFTLRAMAHGKLTLTQAEAIRDLIDSQTANAAKQAVRQLNGELSVTLAPLKDRLLEVIVLLESALEFSEEDLPEIRTGPIVGEMGSIIDSVSRLAGTYAVGHLLAKGMKVAIVGRPNVGKSSLFNSLVGLPRAIVTEIPGTTRDSISEQITIGSLPVVLTDTAGIRDTVDSIESIGMKRTRMAIADADLVLVVIDGTEELLSDDVDVLAAADGSQFLIAINKRDVEYFRNPLIGTAHEHIKSVEVSAFTCAGLDELRAAILEPFNAAAADSSGLLITNARHQDLLCRAEAELRSSAALVGNASEELVLVGLHNALRLLGEITGETTADDVLTRIFATFCIGK